MLICIKVWEPAILMGPGERESVVIMFCGLVSLFSPTEQDKRFVEVSD